MSHSFLAPSAAARWSKCTAAPREEQKYPETTSPAAEEGTRAHAVFESMLGGLRFPDIPRKEAGEMARLLNPIVNYVIDRRHEGYQLYTEEKLDISGALGFVSGTIMGTTDVALIKPGALEILDLKWGVGNYVEEVGNLQLILYAAGALSSWYSQESLPDTIHLTIAQPRHPRGPAIRSWECSIGTLQRHIDTLADAAIQAYADPQFSPGEEQCKWCAARNDCEARREHFVSVVTDQFSPVAGHPVETKAADSTTLASLLVMIPEVENMIRDIRAEAYARAQRGQLPGWKLIAGKRRREWIDEEETLRKARAWKVNGHALGLDGTSPRKLLSPAQMEKIAGLSKQQLKALEKLYKVTPGKPVLAPESDPHPAVSVDVEGHFSPTE